MATTLIPPKTGTKLAKLVSSLKGKGSTLPKLSAKLDWQPHTVRAAITRLRQRGFVIVRTRSVKSGVSTYKLSDGES